MRYKAKTYRLPILALWLLLISFQLYKAFHGAPWWDDAIFMSVAKNVLQGNGYSLVDYDKNYLFHPGISAGPLIIVPTIAMIGLFGPTFWIGGITVLLLINVLLVIAFMNMRRLHGIQPLQYWLIAGAFIVFSFLLANGGLGHSDEDSLPWHILIGEIPASLFGVIAALYAAHTGNKPRTLFITGLIAGLGVLCKLQAMLGGLSLGLYLALVRRNEHKTWWRAVSFSLVCYGVGMALPIASYEMVKFICLGGSAYADYIRTTFHFAGAYSEVHQLPFFLLRLGVLGSHLGLTPPYYSLLGISYSFIVIIFATLIILRSTVRLLRTHEVSYAESALCFASDALWFMALIYLSCWVGVSSDKGIRYCIPGLIYVAGAAALWWGRYAIEGDKIKFAVVTLIIIATLTFGKRDALVDAWEHLRPDPHLSEVMAVRDKIIALRQDNPQLLVFSCSNAFVLEYLLPQSGNFRLCDAMDDAQYKGRSRVLLTYTPDNDGGVITYLPRSIATVKRHNPSEVLARCPANDLYAGQQYFLASCRQ